VEDLTRSLEGEEHHAGVQVLDRVHLELDRGDETEVSVSAAKRPEQLRLVLRVHACGTPVRRNELHRGDAVGLQTIFAG
jgi:hypothetical protein